MRKERGTKQLHARGTLQHLIRQNRVVASITTAIGGEWDVAGALAAINAGGVAEGFRMHGDRTVTSADPLKPFEYDILIAANKAETLRFLRDCLHRALTA